VVLYLHSLIRFLGVIFLYLPLLLLLLLLSSSSLLLLCKAHIPLTDELNSSKCGYQVYGTERKISHLLRGRREEELRN
jgi:hypothetical protein